MKRKLRVGVTGLGRIGWEFHCKKLAAHADCELTAVMDTLPARGLEAEQVFGGCRAYTDYATMIAKAKLDAVVIATPTHLHRSMTETALNAGLHVVLEKPMAVNVTEARAIARCAAANQRVLTVYQPHRLAAYLQHLRQLIADGRIGRVYQVRRGMFAYVRRDDWQSLRKFGGGMLNNYGAHALDQVLHLTGSKVKRLFCELRRVATLGDADDAVKIVYETSDGVVGDVEINMGSALSPFELEVYGATGGISLKAGVFTVRWFDPRKLKVKPLDTGLASAGRQYPTDSIPWQEEQVPVNAAFEVDLFADFARAVRTGKAPFVPAAETVAVMNLIARCRRDSRRVRDNRAT